MFRSLLNGLFGCSHQRTTFPLTNAGKKETYIACLDCGKEFSYNWQEMRVGAPVSKPGPVPVPELAAADSRAFTVPARPRSIVAIR